MSIDPHQALLAQFSQFIAGKISVDDWQTITREFGTGDIASDVTRFYRSKRFGDNDETKRTMTFLRKVREEDEDIGFAIMKRAYDMAGGADSEDLERFPALSVLEAEELSPAEISFPPVSLQSDPFIDIENVPGTFYPGLIEQINQSHRVGIHDATLVLTRKLLENLLIDILRTKYDTQHIDYYYDTNNKRFQPFYNLVDNLEDNLSDFERYSSALDADFITQLNAFRQTANRGAHSLETATTDEEISQYGNKAEYLTMVLFRIRESL